MKIELRNVQRRKTGERLVVAFDIPREAEGEYAALIIKGQPLDRYDLTIANYRRRRSTGYKSQNHHLNGHAMQIANETGQDFADVKLYIKRRAIKRGLPIKDDKDGNIVYSFLDGQPVPISEADMNTEQCAWCIEEAHVLAAELGIILREE